MKIGIASSGVAMSRVRVAVMLRVLPARGLHPAVQQPAVQQILHRASTTESRDDEAAAATAIEPL